METRYSCIKCAVECGCPTCIVFYENRSLQTSCMSYITRFGCNNHLDQSVTCSSYEEIDWIAKIKYAEKLRIYEK